MIQRISAVSLQKMSQVRATFVAAVFLRAVALLALTSAVGCEGGRSGVTISGQVSVNGSPVESGRIMVRSLDSMAAAPTSSADVLDGRYELNDVPVGRNVFSFSGAALTGKSIAGPGGAAEPERVNVIPRTILDQGVERTIEGGGPQDFALDGPV